MAWRVAVDRGGTFTDVVATDPDGRVHVRKLPSGEGVVARALDELGASSLGELRVGTTVATNALLTRAGPRTALVVTRGFGDVLEIGDQTRPALFELFVRRAAPIAEIVVEVEERILADGTVDMALDREAARTMLQQLGERGIRAVAVALVHGYLYPDHERALGELARDMSFDRVTLSSEIAPEIGFLPRATTAAADAFVTPVLHRWADALLAGLPSDAAVGFMKSSGGLAERASFSGVDAVLSGPAGGAVACADVARELGLDRVLGLDMGGTSTDVCRYAGTFEYRREVEIAGVALRVPALDIHTVAAGGGSVLHLRDGRFRAGPDSSGAAPGPACYGLGGPACVTDANVVLGRVQPDFFPRVFGPSGGAPLDTEASREALGAFGDPGVAAAGFVAVADATMAAAISELSTARGHDPATHALVAFGGAAGQHACSIARALGIRHVVLHPQAGVLSAHGIDRADRLAMRSAPMMQPWDDDLPVRQAETVDRLVDEARAELGDPEGEAHVRWDLRYAGASTTLPATTRAGFEDAHRRLFGFARPAASVEVVQLRVEVRGTRSATPARPPPAAPRPLPTAAATRKVGFPGPGGELSWLDTPVHPRETLRPGCAGAGPLLVPGPVTTVVVDPGWTLSVDPVGGLHLRAEKAPELRSGGMVRDPVRLELYWRRFTSIATRMGETLRRVAWSVNIKERLDFSCAVFDSGGRLVTNAPHIPVHLGAMGETVRGLSARLGDEVSAGRSWAVNDPFRGGSHLPDITVITPVFVPGGDTPFAWVANRGHHQDVGGISPGSMPPGSMSLDEEGVRFAGLLLVDGGGFRGEQVRAALGAGPHPVRDPDTCVADLAAQVAANVLGARLLVDLALEEGQDVVAAWMGHILDNGAEAVGAWLDELGIGSRRFEDRMDDGTPIVVELQVAGPVGQRSLVVDFEGTGPASAQNLNAPPAVTRAAVLYVLRCVVGRDIPLNEGCLRAVEIRLPPGSILDPPDGAAVVGGNVETSQRVVDVVLGALGAASASQGTMNNLTFGDGTFGYYETICGGAGAGPDQAGASAVHTHMTNTRMTDVDVLERRCPVVVREFTVRRGSGGDGRHRGGDGVRRVLEFRAPVQVSLLSQRRKEAPFGLEGGASGAPGVARLQPADDGPVEPLDGLFTRSLGPGDALVIETPGGGGFGSPHI